MPFRRHPLSHEPRNPFLSGESVGESAYVLLQRAMVAEKLNISTINLDTTSSLALEVLVAAEGSEAPVLGDNDLLATWKFVLRSAQSLQSETTVRVTSANAHDNLANVDTGNSTVRLTPSTAHTSLQSIGTSARQHFVDTNNVEGVSADTKVEAFFSGVFDQVLVGANTSGLKGLGTQLLILVGDQVDTEGEVVDVGALAAKIENSDFGVGNTTVVLRLRVRLVLAVSVATSRTTSHLVGFC